MLEDQIKTNKFKMSTSEQKNNCQRSMREPESHGLLKLPNENNETQYNLTEKLRKGFKNVTVEPSMLIMALTSLVISFTTQNLALEKACRISLNLTDDVCKSLKLQKDDQNDYEGQTQKLIAVTLIWKTYIIALISGLFSIFVGSWSDKTGRRKIFLVTVVIGQIIVSITNMFQVYFFYDFNLEFLILSEAIIESITGNTTIFLLVSISYICTISDFASRTFRIGILTFFHSVGYLLGLIIGGVFLKSFGYFGSYGLTTTLSVINTLYLIYYVNDTRTATQDKKQNVGNVQQFFKDFFDLSAFKQTLKIVLKKGPHKRRIRVCALLSIVHLLFGCLYGEMTFLYLFTRYKFNWNEVEFSVFGTYYTIVHSLGTIFSITVFCKILKWDDSLLGITSTLSKVAAGIVYCFAPTGKLLYLGPLVEILNGTAFLAIRSSITKLVSSDELGKANSVISLVETFTPLMYIPIYSKLYTATISYLPGAIFLLGSSLTVPVLAVFSWFFYEHRKSLQRSNIEIEVETPLSK